MQSAPRACTPARRRDRGSKGKGGRGGGGSPGLHKRIAAVEALLALPSALKVGETDPGRSRIFRDFTLARARAEPLAPKQKEGVCAAAKRRSVGSRETG